MADQQGAPESRNWREIEQFRGLWNDSAIVLQDEMFGRGSEIDNRAN